MPVIDLSERQLEELANAAVNRGLTVPGVQKKMSLHLSGDADARFTIVDYLTGYILKPQTKEYDSLPEFEDLAMHLKNFSLRELEAASRRFSLSQAYDLLPVNIVLPEDSKQLALTLNGKKRNIRRKDFLAFAENCSVPAKSANAMLNKLCSLKDDFLKQCDQSYLSNELIAKTKELIVLRTEIIA